MGTGETANPFSDDDLRTDIAWADDRENEVELGSQGIGYEAFREDVFELAETQFEARHGKYLLVMFIGPPPQLGGGPIKLSLADANVEESESFDEPTRAATPDAPPGDDGVRVFNIPTAKSLVTVGRSATSDVQILHTSVSREHCYLQVEPSGVVTLLDARSRNGTKVNDVEANAEGRGPPTFLKNGDHMRFGDVKMVFFSARSFRSLVRRLCGE